MKAFEKWFWNEYDPHDDSYNEDTIIKTKVAWKAALKWALDEEDYDPNRDHRDKIIEELDDES